MVKGYLDFSPIQEAETYKESNASCAQQEMTKLNQELDHIKTKEEPIRMETLQNNPDAEIKAEIEQATLAEHGQQSDAQNIKDKRKKVC